MDTANCHEVGYAFLAIISTMSLFGFWLIYEGLKENYRSKLRIVPGDNDKDGE